MNNGRLELFGTSKPTAHENMRRVIALLNVAPLRYSAHLRHYVYNVSLVFSSLQVHSEATEALSRRHSAVYSSSYRPAVAMQLGVEQRGGTVRARCTAEVVVFSPKLTVQCASQEVDLAGLVRRPSLVRFISLVFLTTDLELHARKKGSESTKVPLMGSFSIAGNRLLRACVRRRTHALPTG